MPLITPPVQVSAYLNHTGRDTNINLLIIAENYPEPTLARYFYSPILPAFIQRGIPSFSRELFNSFNVAGVNELDKLTNFLDGIGIGGGRRLLIDALPDGVPPIHPITQMRLNDLVTDIININPNYILIMHNNNIDVADGLLQHPRFHPLIPRLLQNPNFTVHPNVFPFNSGAALPIHFNNALNAVRANGIAI